MINYNVMKTSLSTSCATIVLLLLAVNCIASEAPASCRTRDSMCGGCLPTEGCGLNEQHKWECLVEKKDAAPSFEKLFSDDAVTNDAASLGVVYEESGDDDGRTCCFYYCDGDLPDYFFCMPSFFGECPELNGCRWSASSEYTQCLCV
eukprot:TRINITY_DN17610_c0_g1_i1.p1 TRINITY_DN17610_c0_g1~~TRINITY_DN17610_c0_g1_i1.p1  ORF type:complete len:163 (+),score=24.14 TRINITY_DN17610_c0_g1_i1:46-489(+)